MELKLQDYLKLNKLTPYKAKTVFSYRMRAANYSVNYVGIGGLSFFKFLVGPTPFRAPRGYMKKLQMADLLF